MVSAHTRAGTEGGVPNHDEKLKSTGLCGRAISEAEKLGGVGQTERAKAAQDVARRNSLWLAFLRELLQPLAMDHCGLREGDGNFKLKGGSLWRLRSFSGSSSEWRVTNKREAVQVRTIVDWKLILGMGIMGIGLGLCWGVFNANIRDGDSGRRAKKAKS